MAKVIRRGSAKPNDPIYTTGPVIGGKRFHNPNWADNPPPPISPKKEKSEPKKNSLLEAIAAITPEQAKENERIMARRRAEAVAKGQDPMQPYADDVEKALNGFLDEHLKRRQSEPEDKD